MKLTRAHVSQLPWRDGDGYSWGGEAILSIGNLAIMIGSGKDALALANEMANRWNVGFDDTPDAGRAALEERGDG